MCRSSSKVQNAANIAILHIKDALSGVMSDSPEFEGPLVKMLTTICASLQKDTLVKMIEQMCASLDEDVLAQMIEDTYDHLNTTTLHDLIENSVPQLISDGAILDQQTFGSPDNRDILELVILATRDGSHDEVQVSDEMVAAEMLRPPSSRPAFFNLILIMYQKWSTKWHQYNPEHP